MKQLPWIGLLSLLILSGCTARNVGDCSLLKLHFHYYGDGQTDIFSEKIEHLQLLIFDDSKRLIRQTYLGAQQLTATQTYPLVLPPGSYQLVAIANNQAEHTSIHLPHKEAQLNELAVLTSQSPRLSVRNQSPLYWGEVAVNNQKNKIQNLDVRLFNPTHFKLKAKLLGSSQSEIDPTQLSLRIRNIPANLHFSSLQKTAYITVQPHLQAKKENHLETALLHLFRPHEPSQTQIEVLHQQQMLQSISLQEILELYPAGSWNLQELYLDVQFNFEDLNVSVNIPNWDIDALEPDFN